MTSRADDDEDAASLLADDLTDARRRGLSFLDLQNPPNQQRVAVPHLEVLARRYADDATGNRIPLIRDLLRESLEAYAADGSTIEAKFIRGLFFDDSVEAVTSSSPRDLLESVRKGTQLSDDNFGRLRRVYFEQYAEFLQKFVDQRVSTRSPTRDSPPSRSWRRYFVTALVAVALLVTVAVIVGALLDSRAGGHAAGTHNPSNGSSASGGSLSSSAPMLTFNDLGSTSSHIIEVYPGVKATRRDRMTNGTFRSGAVVPAVCITNGRTVASDPSAGELLRRSSSWVRIDAVPDVQQYATLVYADVSNISRLPHCPNPE